jgi:hypothetical protein
MNSENNTGAIALTITFTDPDLKSEERNDEVVRLLEELSDRSDIESVDLVRDPNPPDGNMSGLGRPIVGMLKALVRSENIKKVFGFLGDYLRSPIAIELEVDGDKKKVKLTANNPEEVERVMLSIEKFIKNS